MEKILNSSCWGAVVKQARAWLKDFLNLFLKSSCGLCSRSAQVDGLCLYCERQLLQSVPRLVLLKVSPLRVWVGGVYDGVLKRSLTTLKYDSHPELAKPLGEAVGRAWLSVGAGQRGLKVVPIPLHPNKLKIRGFNQAELLAEYFCGVTGLSLERKGLHRLRETKAQFGLTAVQRQKNLQDAFAVGEGLQGPVLLFDDIYTTGSTIRSATSALNQAGISVYGVVAVAAPLSGLSN